MEAGEAFRFASGDDHWWIVISDPAKDPDNVLIVNMTSFRQDKDQSCLLNPGDHEIVEHNSVIFYADSRVHAASHLNHLVSMGRVKCAGKLFPPHILQLIREGAMQSKFMKLKHAQILIDQGLVAP